MQNQPMFEINGSGRYVNVDKSYFIKQVTECVELFNIKRNINSLGHNIEIDFSLINGSLYLNFNQLKNLFDVGDKVLRDHINNVLGFWLHTNLNMNKGGGQIAPPLSHTEVRKAIQIYKENFPNRNKLSFDESVELIRAEQLLTDSVAESINDESIDPQNIFL